MFFPLFHDLDSGNPYGIVNIYHSQGQIHFVTLLSLNPKLYNLRCII